METSEIRHRTSEIWHRASDIRRKTSDMSHTVRHQPSDLRHWTSDSRHTARHQTSYTRHGNIRNQTSEFRHTVRHQPWYINDVWCLTVCLMSDVWYPISNVLCPMADVLLYDSCLMSDTGWCLMSDVRCPMSYFRHRTSEIWHRASDNEMPHTRYLFPMGHE